MQHIARFAKSLVHLNCFFFATCGHYANTILYCTVRLRSRDIDENARLRNRGLNENAMLRNRDLDETVRLRNRDLDENVRLRNRDLQTGTKPELYSGIQCNTIII